MYQVITGIYRIEGRTYTGYGIGNKDIDIKVEDVTCVKKEMETLVEICNRQKLADIHLMDIVEDFLVSRSYICE